MNRGFILTVVGGLQAAVRYPDFERRSAAQLFKLCFVLERHNASL